MKTIADVVFETEAINSGILNYPLNIFIPMAEKKFPKDMDESLLKLKTILEDKGD